MESNLKEIKENYDLLCQEVLYLQMEWNMYLELYDKEQNLNLLSNLPTLFDLIENALSNDVTMRISRLCDPYKYPTKKNRNLSFDTLAKKCSTINGLEEKIINLQIEYKPFKKWRDRKISHNDYATLTKPHIRLLPEINKTQIDKLILSASGILNFVSTEFHWEEFNTDILNSEDIENLIRCLKILTEE